MRACHATCQCWHPPNLANFYKTTGTIFFSKVNEPLFCYPNSAWLYSELYVILFIHHVSPLLSVNTSEQTCNPFLGRDPSSVKKHRSSQLPSWMSRLSLWFKVTSGLLNEMSPNSTHCVFPKALNLWSLRDCLNTAERSPFSILSKSSWTSYPWPS